MVVLLFLETDILNVCVICTRAWYILERSNESQCTVKTFWICVSKHLVYVENISSCLRCAVVLLQASREINVEKAQLIVTLIV